MEEQKIALCKKRRDVTGIVNEDVLEEIMLRLSTKSLIRFQVVSNQWRGMITSRRFKEKYMVHQKTQEPKFLSIYEDRSWGEPNMALKTMTVEWSSALLVEEEEEDVYHISNADQNCRRVVSKSVDGLFLFYYLMIWTRPIKVINPATRWSQTLPLASAQLGYEISRKVAFPIPGFGKDAVTGTYKLVLLDVYAKDTSSCEVFDFGVKQWRQVVLPPQMKHNSDREPTFANGWLYWFTKDLTQLVAFDLHTEMFQVVPNPITSSSSTVVDMRMDSVDDGSRLVWISETNKDGMQHFWRLTNHNTGGLLHKLDKMFSFDSNKLNSTWFLNTHGDDSLFPYLTAISKSGNHLMLSKPGSQNLLLLQPLNPKSILCRLFSYPPYHPKNSVVVPYFPSLASPL